MYSPPPTLGGRGSALPPLKCLWENLQLFLLWKWVLVVMSQVHIYLRKDIYFKKCNWKMLSYLPTSHLWILTCREFIQALNDLSYIVKKAQSWIEFSRLIIKKLLNSKNKICDLINPKDLLQTVKACGGFALLDSTKGPYNTHPPSLDLQLNVLMLKLYFECANA